ncbi:Hypothetical protein AA314_02165 [Archangium gephyra]|nr:Hypothetical protein AA314_02165 [Archangium gephyra]
MDQGFVVNYDPGLELAQIEQYAFRSLNAGRIFFNYFEDNVSPHDVVYFGNMRDLKAYFRESSFETILSVSPYGFHVINPDTNPFLGMGGKVLTLGNARNQWLDVRFTDDEVPGIFAPGLSRDYSSYSIPDSPVDPCRFISERIQAEYVSFTTAPGQGQSGMLQRTALDVVKAFTKNNL